MTIDVTGGEPFLDFEDLIQLLKGIRPFKKEIILNTNGTLLPVDKIKRLNGLIDELRIALHHYDEQKNFEIIKARSSFSNIKKSLEKKKF